jgi:hypothetical protein
MSENNNQKELEEKCTKELVELHNSHFNLQKSTKNQTKKKNHALVRNKIYSILKKRNKEHLII